jgi:hypothetical protein
MSVDGQVLGAGTVAGMGAGAVSTLANTGDPIFVGTVVAVAVVVVAGLVARIGR